MEENKASVEIGFGKRVMVSHDGFSVAGAVLEIDKGSKTDMVFQREFGKLLYLLGGKMKVSVLRDGVINSISVDAGASFYVRPGLVYQLEALEKAIVVEFAEAGAYIATDVTCLVKGTQIKAPEPVAVAAIGIASAEEVKPEVISSVTESIVPQAADAVAEKIEKAIAVNEKTGKKRRTKKKGLN